MKSRQAFLVLFVGLALLGWWLRPRTVRELWVAQELESGDERRSSFPGVATILDFDGDGLADILWSLPAVGGTPGLRLKRNLGGRRFADATEESGLSAVYGPCGDLGIGDFDGDGRVDLFVSRGLTGDLLLLNDGGRFRDATPEWGLPSRGTGGPVVVADLDRDGRLDVYTCGAWESTIYLQSSRGRFQRAQMPRVVGASDATALDVDGDGQLDLVVVSVDASLLVLLGDGSGGFREAKEGLGSLSGGEDGGEPGQGIDWGDLDGDGIPEIVVTGPRGSRTRCHSRPEQTGYRDIAGVSGLAEASVETSDSATVLFDMDNDGDLDVFVAAGSTYRSPEGGKERSHVYINDGAGHFREVGEHFGESLSTARNLRGATCADLDRDGRLDLLLAPADRPPVIFWNRLGARHWLRLRLESDLTRSPPATPPEGIGARIEIEVAGREQHRWVRRTAGYLSSREVPVHFGLDRAERADSLRIRWPSGEVDEHVDLEAGREYVAHEGGRLMAVEGP